MDIDDGVLRLLVVATRAGALDQMLTPAAREEDIAPEPGDLVVEVSHQIRHIDPDAIGWLDYHGDAPINEDGSGPKREVWDIVPLSGRGHEGRNYQRWENAEFRRVPKPMVQRAGLHPPALPHEAEPVQA